MGFLARFFGGNRGSNQQSNHSARHRGGTQLEPWPLKALDKKLELPSESGTTLYVYDDSPFRNARHGDAIEVEFFPGEARLYSTKSGSEVDTREANAVCLLHKRQPVGVLFFGKDHARLAYAKGIRLLAKATVGDRLPEHGNIRALTIHLPASWSETRQLIDNYELNQRIPSHAERIEFNEWDQQDYEELCGKSTWVFEDVRLNFLPVPEGSSAKPHVLASSADGRKIFRLTARNGVYRDVAAAMQSSSNFLVFAERRNSNEGLVGYRMRLAHW